MKGLLLTVAMTVSSIFCFGNMNSSFWLTPEGKRIECEKHHLAAMEMFPDLQKREAVRTLVQMGFVRVTVIEGDLYVADVLTPMQIERLKQITLEEGLRLVVGGWVVPHEEPKWKLPLLTL